MIKAWLQRRKDRKAAKRYREGWDYAAGEMLLNSVNSAKRLRAMIQLSVDFNVHDEFDAGIKAAIRKWEKDKK